MSFRVPSILQMAIHEAGHAYGFASIVRGEFPVELGLETTPVGPRGWSKRLKVSETEGAAQAAALLCERDLRRWIAASEAAIALAGPLAEARQRERSSAGGLVFLSVALPQLIEPSLPLSDTDFQHLRRMLRIVDPVGSLEAARKILLEVNDHLDGCWPGVMRLGRKLLNEGRIDAARLREHFEEWPAFRPSSIHRQRR